MLGSIFGLVTAAAFWGLHGQSLIAGGVGRDRPELLLKIKQHKNYKTAINLLFVATIVAFFAGLAFNLYAVRIFLGILFIIILVGYLIVIDRITAECLKESHDLDVDS